MAESSKQVPLAIVTGIIGLLVGGGLMLMAMTYFGYHWEREPDTSRPPFEGKGGKGGGMMGGKGKGKGEETPGTDKGGAKEGNGTKAEDEKNKGEPPARDKATPDAKGKSDAPSGAKKDGKDGGS
jgi:hypothetical protein